VDNQHVTVAVPFSMGDGGTAAIVVRANGATSNACQALLAPAEPQIFNAASPRAGLIGNALALNEDGTVNSSSSPAKGGSIVTVFVNGAGLITPDAADGTYGQFNQTPILPLSVTYSTEYDIRYGRAPVPLTITYAGGSPGLLAGLTQVNLRLPPTPAIDFIEVHITVGSAVTSASIAVASQ
jgi:uncharacterized protein (TIGR03437 family)